MPTTDGPRPFTTARLDALPLDPAYADEMAAVLADPALYVFTGGGPPDPDALRARYERQAAGSPDPGERWWNWVLRLRADGRLAGYIQATVRGPSAEIAWVVGVPWQGRGYAAEAAKGLVAHLVAAGGIRTLVAHIHPDHAASAAVAVAAGLEPTGERREEDGELRWTADTHAPGVPRTLP
ncbi:GNAT family N-acetyltransferase [Streptomyces sp. NPDC059452]|uniref:GNAT family N-acetyltransferase n=1 Tax=Streptomyces sp. NPDC059452 TaxID=3346835 RepID=UPI003698F290